MVVDYVDLFLLQGGYTKGLLCLVRMFGGYGFNSSGCTSGLWFRIWTKYQAFYLKVQYLSGIFFYKKMWIYCGFYVPAAPIKLPLAAAHQLLLL